MTYTSQKIFITWYLYIIDINFQRKIAFHVEILLLQIYPKEYFASEQR